LFCTSHITTALSQDASYWNKHVALAVTYNLHTRSLVAIQAWCQVETWLHSANMTFKPQNSKQTWRQYIRYEFISMTIFCPDFQLKVLEMTATGCIMLSLNVRSMNWVQSTSVYGCCGMNDKTVGNVK
jgi:hypothetical protein